MEVRGTLYILKDIREYGVKANSSSAPRTPASQDRGPAGGSLALEEAGPEGGRVLSLVGSVGGGPRLAFPTSR